MKKKILWIALAVLLLAGVVLGVFFGCNNGSGDTNVDPSESTVDGTGELTAAQEAINYLKAIYNDEGAKTPINYERYGIIRIGGVPYTVVWTTDASEDMIKIIVNEDGTVTIDVNEEWETDTPYTLTATVTDEDGNTASYTWNYILPEAVDMVSIVKAAYALAPGESLPYEVTLRGEVISIDQVYNPEYANITVTMVVKGAEDMPIKCYRLKGAGVEDLMVGNIITVTGTLKNYNGTIEFDAGCILDAVEKGNAVEAPTDPGEILKAAYALAEDTALPYPVELTGKVTKIETPYDPDYSNISVVIEVEGYPQYPILCYRLKGTDVDKIAVGDTITVNGIIKNYKGTIEYDSGCIMTARISGGGVAQAPSSDAAKILADAFALKEGESLPYRATLTGEVISIDEPYSSEYENVTVTMRVNGKRIQCYRMKGDNIANVDVTDTITVTGVIKNHYGTIEFDKGCTLVSWVKGSRVVAINYGPLKTGTAYNLKMALPDSKTVYFTGDMSGRYFATSRSTNSAIAIYMEKIEGKGVRFFYKVGTEKYYMEIQSYINDEGETRACVAIVKNPTAYWTYDTDGKVYTVTIAGAKYYLGTYTNSSGTTYDTISCSQIRYILDGNAANVGKTQFVAQFVEAVTTSGSSTTAGTTTLVTAPKTGVAYKMGFDQLGLKKYYYFIGEMNGYYGATESDASMGVDVYLESATNGYKVYFKDAKGVKQYITITTSDSHVNFGFATKGGTAFKFDTENSALYTTLSDGSVYYMGTYGTYYTVGTVAQSKISSSYLVKLYKTTGVGGASSAANSSSQEPTNNGTATLVTSPTADKSYKMGIKVKDGTIYYFTGLTDGVSYRLGTSTNAANAVDVKLETVSSGKYRLYFMQNGMKVYIRVYERSSTDSEGNTKLSGSLELTTTKPSEYYTYDKTANTLIYTKGENSYYFGAYNTYTNISASSTYYITDSYAANLDVSQFPVRFYTVTGIVGEPTIGNTTSGGTIDSSVVSNPTAGTAYKFGLNQSQEGKLYYFTGKMSGKYGATSTNLADAVDVKLETVSSGKYRLYFMDGSTKTYIRVYDELEEGKTRPTGKIELTTTKPSEYYTYDSTIKTLIYTNGENAYYIGTYNSYNTLGVSSVYYITGGNASNLDVSQYPARFYPTTGGTAVGGGSSSGGSSTGGSSTATVVTAPQTGTAYKLGLNQTAKGSIYYFTGTMSGYYGATDTTYANGVNVYLETATGGYKVYFKDSANAKQYIYVVASGTHINFTYSTSSYSIFKFDEDLDSLYTDVSGANYYLGTYGNYVTFGTVSESNKDSSYVSHLYTGGSSSGGSSSGGSSSGGSSSGGSSSGGSSSGGSSTGGSSTATVVTAPQTGTAYKLGLNQTAKGSIYYFTGTMSGYYGATDTTYANGVNVYLETATGGYKVYFKDSANAKQYINVVANGNFINFTYSTSSSSVFTFDEELDSLYTDVSGTNYYLGTYGSYVTFGTVSESNKNSNYVSHLYTGSSSSGGSSSGGSSSGGSSSGGSSSGGSSSGGSSTGGSSTATVVTAPQTGTAYKLGLNQTAKGSIYYFTGEMSSYYGATTTTYADGVDVYLETATGGYKVYFKDSANAKQYIYVVANGNYINFTYSTSSSSVFTFDEELDSLYTDVSGTNYYLGTYGSYVTFGTVSESNKNSNYVSHLYTEDTTGDGGSSSGGSSSGGSSSGGSSSGGSSSGGSTTEPTVVTAPQTGVAYKLGLNQTTKGSIYYFTGTMSSYYGATETTYADGVDVYLETASGGYKVYFMDSSNAKQYIYIVANGTHINFTYSTSSSSVFTFDEELDSLYTDVSGTNYYLGTYGNYVTFGTVSESNKDSSYVSHLYTGGSGTSDGGDTGGDGDSTTEPTVVTAPQTGVAYKLGLNQTTKGSIYYFTGEMSSYYGATTTTYADGVDVYLETATGGYKVYFTDSSNAKQYIYVVANGNFINFTYSTSSSSVFTFDEELDSLYTDVSGTNYYLGTYGNYVTFGTVSESYKNSNYVSHLYTEDTTGDGGSTGDGGNGGGSTTPSEPTGTEVAYSMSTLTNYTSTGNYSIPLDSDLTMDLTSAKIKDGLIYVYDNDVNQTVVELKAQKPLTSIKLNAGSQKDGATVSVWGSNDGETWGQIEIITVTGSKYTLNDYTVVFDQAYSYVKMEVTNVINVRISTITVWYKED